MNETHMEALRQYETEVLSVRKGRGAWICETRQGLRLLREYKGTVKRLEFEDQVLSALDTRTSLRTDPYVRNREGSLLTTTGDGTSYVLKEWFADRECSLRDSYEVRQAVSRLAILHSQLRRIPKRQEWTLGSICREPMDQEIRRHNRELLRTVRFIRERRGKTDFELSVLSAFRRFFEQAQEAADMMEELMAAEGDLAVAELTGSCDFFGGQLCHGDLDQHHLLMGPGYTAIVDYNRMHLGIQTFDLYRIMRKTLEKHGWNGDLGISILDSYQRVLPMDRQEKQSLYTLFLYPEKYWKQLNFYYNTNKARVPDRNTGKLKSLESQEPARQQFLKRLKAYCQ